MINRIDVTMDGVELNHGQEGEYRRVLQHVSRIQHDKRLLATPYESPQDVVLTTGDMMTSLPQYQEGVLEMVQKTDTRPEAFKNLQGKYLDFGAWQPGHEDSYTLIGERGLMEGMDITRFSPQTCSRWTGAFPRVRPRLCTRLRWGKSRRVISSCTRAARS